MEKQDIEIETMEERYKGNFHIVGFSCYQGKKGEFEHVEQGEGPGPCKCKIFWISGSNFK
jgi:hypothetical protein